MYAELRNNPILRVGYLLGLEAFSSKALSPGIYFDHSFFRLIKVQKMKPAGVDLIDGKFDHGVMTCSFNEDRWSTYRTALAENA